MFATNHLGPFLLTNLLLDTLKASAPSRVLNVASKGLMMYPFLDVEFDNLNGERKWTAQRAYYHSKLAHLMFTYDLARRLKGTGVTVNCVRVPAVKIDMDRYEDISPILRAMYRVKRYFSISAEAMGETYVRLLTAPEFADMTGTYFDETCKPVGSSRKSLDEATWARLWDTSVRLTRLEDAVAV